METIISNDYTPFDNEESEMTLLMGTRCVDGVILANDRKMTQTLSSGIHYLYDDKITGEIDGILTGFAGDAGAFEVFRTTLRDYVMNNRNEHAEKSSHNKENTGASFDRFKLKISQIQHEFYCKYQQHQYRVFLANIFLIRNRRYIFMKGMGDVFRKMKLCLSQSDLGHHMCFIS